ncbi:restriction endonuclease, partial [Candidatus Woesearchaeota archaeon]|nr:restriction endonuclease [Candidatus Woesearchaeota archaeon]
LLIRHNGKSIRGIPIRFDSIGSWWDRSANELDIVAHDASQRTTIIGEVKWTRERMDVDVLEALLQKMRYLHVAGSYTIILVSKSGFTKKCKDRITSLKGLALDLKELATLL